MLLVSALSLPAAARAQARVRLELRPHPGDTLRMVLEQQTEGSTGSSGAGGAAHEVTTRMRMSTRAMVLARLARGVTLLSITDSVALGTDDQHGQKMAQVSSARWRGAPCGCTSHRTARRASSWTAAAPPARARVAEGRGAAHRGHARRVPGAARDGGRAVDPRARDSRRARTGRPARAVLPRHLPPRLDRRGAALAYISVRGELARNVGAPQGQPVMRGTVTGTMLLDRARGWIMDSRFVVAMHTTLAAAAASEPMRFVTSVTQRVPTLEKAR